MTLNCVGNTTRGHKFGLAVYGSATTDAATVRLVPSRWGLRYQPETAVDDGIGESLWETKGDEVLVAENIGGNITMNPRPNQFQALCMCIFGGSAFSSNIKLPGDLCSFFHLLHYDPNFYDTSVGTTYKYNNCVTQRAVFSAQERGLLNLSWDVVSLARVLTVTGGSFPALAMPTQQPFAFRSGTLTVDSYTLPMKGFSLSIENNLMLDNFNALTASSAPSAGINFVLTHETPWESEPGLLEWLADTPDGTIAEASLNFVRGSDQLKFDFPSLFAHTSEPEIAGRQRIMNQFSWRAKYDPAHATAAPLKITAIDA